MAKHPSVFGRTLAPPQNARFNICYLESVVDRTIELVLISVNELTWQLIQVLFDLFIPMRPRFCENDVSLREGMSVMEKL